ncbi:MAG: phage holin family protein [Candidatus Accumulibacter sp.]|jgi:uncharacterized membrane protein YqjE|nr:phage holin family protein [Accumulibacter sp.]
MGENAGGAPDGRASDGLLSALGGIAATLLASGRTRLELISNEIEAGKLRAVELLLTALAMSFCFGVAIVLAFILLIVSFWEQRLVVLGLGILIFLVPGGLFLAHFKRESHRPERVFTDSVAELEEDLRQLKAMTGHEPPLR